jgi:hypothetical protein
MAALADLTLLVLFPLLRYGQWKWWQPNPGLKVKASFVGVRTLYDASLLLRKTTGVAMPQLTSITI